MENLAAWIVFIGCLLLVIMAARLFVIGRKHKKRLESEGQQFNAFTDAKLGRHGFKNLH